MRFALSLCTQGQHCHPHLTIQRRPCEHFLPGSSTLAINCTCRHCPSLDIMLPKEDRHLTVCSDAAHYIIHTSARLIPLQDKEQYDSYCGAATARLFLESLYQPFISLRPDVLHLKLVSPSRLWLSDAKLHKHMNVFLCKTRHCQELMKRHIVRMGWRSHVWLLGHTAGDPTIDLPPTSEAFKGALVSIIAVLLLFPAVWDKGLLWFEHGCMRLAILLLLAGQYHARSQYATAKLSTNIMPVTPH